MRLPILTLAFSALFVFASCLKMPKADFSVMPVFPQAGTETVFVNQSSDASRFEWNFGNGKSSTLEHPTTVFDTAGFYTVSLRAMEGLRSNTKSISVIVVN